MLAGATGILLLPNHAGEETTLARTPIKALRTFEERIAAKLRRVQKGRGRARARPARLELLPKAAALPPAAVAAAAAAVPEQTTHAFLR